MSRLLPLMLVVRCALSLQSRHAAPNLALPRALMVRSSPARGGCAAAAMINSESHRR